MLALGMFISIQAQKKEATLPDKQFRDKMMAEKLKLSEEQRQQAKKLTEDYRKKRDELRKKDDMIVRDWRSQMMDLNRKHREEMRGLLTDAQRGQLEKMKIAEIDATARMEKMKLLLDLNDVQIEKLKKQRTEMLGKMKTIRDDPAKDNLKKREEIKTLLEKRKENMKSILTEEQMKKMQEMRKPMPRHRRVLS
jgi:hypothetical protein